MCKTLSHQREIQSYQLLYPTSIKYYLIRCCISAMSNIILSAAVSHQRQVPSYQLLYLASVQHYVLKYHVLQRRTQCPQMSYLSNLKLLILECYISPSVSNTMPSDVNVIGAQSLKLNDHQNLALI